ncbi:metallophosphoesterase [Spirochaetia bacterium 38H-sp]|uniref:Metallophosphoesterase n=1 Tax=Rarispira pelagica TaxID=3141764 RepID=A0ABU9UBL2_9SPIR
MIRFKKSLESVLNRTSLPEAGAYLLLLRKTIQTLLNMKSSVRPLAKDGLPGGLVYLSKNIPTVIVPDLHARGGFFYRVLCFEPLTGTSVLDMLFEGKINVLCVGDGFHSEARGRARWKEAFDEYATGYKKRNAMDEEMRESFSLMEMVMMCKNKFPDNFFFLKGNHENIANEEGDGNHPFRKYVFEGEMVREYVLRFYGEEFLDTFANFEHMLPILAVGNNFLTAHAEPMEPYTKDEIINYRENPHVVYGLTWTDNDMADENSVALMLRDFLPDCRNAVFFGGHRPVPERFLLRAGGLHVQIHNPDKESVVFMQPDKGFDPDSDIIELR